MATAYPLINGVKYDWSSVEINLGDAGVFTGVTELTYSDTLDRGMARGTSAQVLATTRGEYSCEASISLYKKEHADLVAALGDGFMESFFTITVSYSEPGGDGTITDKLFGCAISGDESGGSQGSDPLAVTCPLYVTRISWNGIDPLAGMLK